MSESRICVLKIRSWSCVEQLAHTRLCPAGIFSDEPVRTSSGTRPQPRVFQGHHKRGEQVCQGVAHVVPPPPNFAVNTVYISFIPGS